MPIGWSPKFSVVTDRFAAFTLVPERLTTWGEPEALSVTVRVPVLTPVAAGVKVTLMVQLEPPAMPVPQVFVSAKSPLAEMLVVRAALPTLKSVTVCAALVVPSTWLAKRRLDGLRLTPGTFAGLILATKALEPPLAQLPQIDWNAPAMMGKFEELATPVT